MKRKYAQTFNEIAPLYDSARLGYPPQLYEVIHLYTQIDRTSTILEIGCGTGIATQEIYNKWEPNIIAIDPGKQLLEVAAKKSSSHSKIEYINCDFKDFSRKEKFDAIFSATAFHWLDKRRKYKKSYKLLKEEGKLILYWNNYVIEEEEVNASIQEIYKRYHPDGALEDARLHYRNKIRNRKNEINNSKIFDLIVHHEHSYSLKMKSEGYVDLLKSFSNNSSLKGGQLDKFYEEVKNYINSRGGEIKLTIVINLEIAKKKEPVFGYDWNE